MVEHSTLTIGHPAEARVESLVDETFGAAFGSAYWRWKYRHPFAAGDADVFLASIDDTVVGVLHYLRGRYRFGPSVVASASAAGDLVVDPEYRGHKVAGGLSGFASDQIRQSQDAPSMVLMWTRPRLGSFYTKTLGYTRVPSGTTRFEKRLDGSSRLAALRESGLLEQLAAGLPGRDGPAVELRVAGTRPVVVSVTGGQIAVGSGPADLVISGPYRVVIAYLEGARPRVLWPARLRRRLKVRGRPDHRRRAAAFFPVHRQILAELRDG